MDRVHGCSRQQNSGGPSVCLMYSRASEAPIRLSSLSFSPVRGVSHLHLNRCSLWSKGGGMEASHVNEDFHSAGRGKGETWGLYRLSFLLLSQERGQQKLFCSHSWGSRSKLRLWCWRCSSHKEEESSCISEERKRQDIVNFISCWYCWFYSGTI